MSLKKEVKQINDRQENGIDNWEMHQMKLKKGKRGKWEKHKHLLQFKN